MHFILGKFFQGLQLTSSINLRCRRTLASSSLSVCKGFADAGTAGVPFLVAELGRDADPFMLHLYAASLRRNAG